MLKCDDMQEVVKFPLRHGDWIQCVSGIPFFPLDPRCSEVTIEDIAHSLAMQCRFTGHVKKFYSVAQHSVGVSLLCDPADALWGLLHDASEAYICDLSRPVKHQPEFLGYREIEAKLQSVIMERFGLSYIEPKSVKEADTIMLGVEALGLMSPLTMPDNWRWCTDKAKLSTMIIDRTWYPDEAKEIFLKRFEELTK